MELADDLHSHLALPTAGQLAWQNLEIGMFVHFAPNTWQNEQGDRLTTPLSAINPEKLDVAQWVDVAESMKAGYIIFVAKHVGGFCMWPTATTGYNIANTPWRGGGGDVCGELAGECRRRNMKLGFYISPRDDHFGVAEGGKSRSGNSAHQDLYNTIYTQQLTELATGYGELIEFWFDGSADGELVRPIIDKHQPGIQVFQTSAATIRWIGNEDGLAPYPTWNTVGRNDYEYSPKLKSGPQLGDGRWLPAECDVPIRADWFWSESNEPTLKSLDALMGIYMKSVGHGTNLLLNHTPDKTGLIPIPDARRAAEFGIELGNRFGNPAAKASGTGFVMEAKFSSPTTVRYAVTMEDIAMGERVTGYRIELLSGDVWQTVAEGSAIGHKKIDAIKPKEAIAARWVCTESVAEPHLKSFSLYS